MSKSVGPKGSYQKVMPVTSKNIGRDYLKNGVGAGSDTGNKAAARRLKQLEKQRAREAELRHRLLVNQGGK